MHPVARLGDPHSCPLADPKPHVGGLILGPGLPTVLVGDRPVAVVGDSCACLGAPPNAILLGSASVLAGDKAIARMNDATLHGGRISSGCPAVLAG